MRALQGTNGTKPSLGGMWWDEALEHSAFHVPRSAHYKEQGGGIALTVPPSPSPPMLHPQLSLFLLVLVAEGGAMSEGKCTAGDGKCCAGTDRAARSPRPAVMHIRCFISPRCCMGRAGPGVPLWPGGGHSQECLQLLLLPSPQLSECT